MSKKEKPEVSLVGKDGNAFAILGECRRAAKRAGWTDEEFMEFDRKAKNGDYDHLLQTVLTHFEVS